MNWSERRSLWYKNYLDLLRRLARETRLATMQSCTRSSSLYYHNITDWNDGNLSAHVSATWQKTKEKHLWASCLVRHKIIQKWDQWSSAAWVKHLTSMPKVDLGPRNQYLAINLIQRLVPIKGVVRKTQVQPYGKDKRTKCQLANSTAN